MYARQSLDVTEGIDRQLSRCRKLAEGRGWAVAHEYVDNDVSASKARGVGTAWANLLADAEGGRITVVIAVDLDRLVRSTRDLLTLIDLGVSVVTVDGEIDLSTADGEFRATLLASLARFEVRRKSERQKRANAHRTANGKPVPGRRPFGFESDRVTIREAEAEWIRWSVQSILEGGSVYSVRARLNAEGVLTATGRPWLTTTVRQMLMRPSIAGLVQHQGAIVADTLPAIVDREQWEAMRLILENPERTPKRGPKAVHIASGVVTCSVCGSALRHRAAYGRARVPRYLCSREKLAVRDNLQHPTADAAYLERVLAFEVFESLMKDDTERGTDDAAPLRAERAELARRRIAQQDLYELPGADVNAIAKRIAQLARDIERLDERIADAVNADARASLRAVAREALEAALWEGSGSIRAQVEPQRSWLARWDAIEPEKRMAIIRNELGPVELDFDGITLTRSGKRIGLTERNEQ